MFKALAAAGLAIGLGLGTSACTDEYGYSGVSVGYSSGYGGGYYPGYSSSYYSPSYGWYEDYYYPGTGIYVYDSYRRPYRWNDAQQRYWLSRQNYGYRDGYRDRREVRENWQDFRRDRRDYYRDGRDYRRDRRDWRREDRRDDD